MGGIIWFLPVSKEPFRYSSPSRRVLSMVLKLLKFEKLSCGALAARGGVAALPPDASGAEDMMILVPRVIESS